jgi:hypothetical protein
MLRASAWPSPSTTVIATTGIVDGSRGERPTVAHPASIRSQRLLDLATVAP